MIPVELLCSSYSEDSRQARKSSNPQNLNSLSTLLELNLEGLWRINSHFLPGGVGGIYRGVRWVLWVKVGLGGPTCQAGRTAKFHGCTDFPTLDPLLNDLT
jgi:hypothetical protein